MRNIALLGFLMFGSTLFAQNYNEESNTTYFFENNNIIIHGINHGVGPSNHTTSNHTNTSVVTKVSTKDDISTMSLTEFIDKKYNISEKSSHLLDSTKDVASKTWEATKNVTSGAWETTADYVEEKAIKVGNATKNAVFDWFNETWEEAILETQQQNRELNKKNEKQKTQP